MEKRQGKRYPRRVTVIFGKKMCEHIGSTTDVSEQGMLIRASRIYSPGTPIMIRLSLENEERIDCTGVIQWAKRVPSTLVRFVPNGMGILLTNIPSGYQKWIGQLDSMKTKPRAMALSAPL